MKCLKFCHHSSEELKLTAKMNIIIYSVSLFQKCLSPFDDLKYFGCLSNHSLSTFSKIRMLDSSKLKEFADDNYKF